MILVINSGSSSIKFKLFNTKNNITEISEGLTERIGIDGRLSFKYNGQKYNFDCDLKNHEAAINIILEKLKEFNIIENINDIKGIGFRVVHGGSISSASLITKDVMDKINEAVELAPIHNPGAIVAINAVNKLMPNIKKVACFDTSYHQTIPEINYLYAVPYSWYTDYKVRKYGFHGISYEYISQQFAKIINKKEENTNMIVCHLGNGGSITAVKNGKSFDTTMGLTPLAGIMMGTRSGDIDVSICNYMSQQLNVDISEINRILNNESGLKGMSNLSSDIRDLVQAVKDGNKNAILAIEKYTQLVADFIVKYINYFDKKIDGIIFTAGIGENASLIREKVIQKINILKVSLDNDKNNTFDYEDYIKLNDEKSEINVYAIRTNEEKMICLNTLNLIK